MTKKHRKNLNRILNASILFSLALMLDFTGILRPLGLGLLLAAYLVVGHDVLKKAFLGVIHGQVFDENFLMALATLGAVFTGEYPEAVAVMLFYQIGEWFQSYAVGRSRRSIAALMDIRPDYANLLRDGAESRVDPEEVAPGDLILIKPGERVPLDGQVVEGSSSLDTAALTGESQPRSVGAGDAVISGCVNGSGLLTVRVTSHYSQSTVARILDLVENASSKKSSSEAFITRFARWYTPVVVCAALALAILPPLFGLGAWKVWVYRAMTFLVISCPCALVISVPLSFFGGLGGASRSGILIKGSNYLEALAKTKIAVFDKTGTLTRGSFAVAEVGPAQDVSPQELLNFAAAAERHSSHPIAQSLRRAAGEEAQALGVEAVTDLPGRGISAVVEGTTVLVGNARLMEEENIPFVPCTAPGTAVYVARGGSYLGWVLIADQLKPEAAEALAGLKQAGVAQTVMLTGDRAEVAHAVAAQVGVDTVCADLLPADKVEQVENLLETKPQNSTLLFVGDGENDAPVLARADLGVAMGAMGSDAAIEAADVVLMDDDLSRLPVAIRHARRVMSIVRQNIVFALAIKGVTLILAAMGYASMWGAVFADVGVMVLAVLNAMRALHIPKKQ